MVPTSTLETAAAVGYYYGLSPPFGPADVKLRVASRIQSIGLSNNFRCDGLCSMHRLAARNSSQQLMPSRHKGCAVDTACCLLGAPDPPQHRSCLGA